MKWGQINGVTHIEKHPLVKIYIFYIADDGMIIEYGMKITQIPPPDE